MSSSGEHRRRRALPWALGVVVLIAAGVVGALIANAVNSPSNATTTRQTRRLGRRRAT
jgi:hypothetical protein